MRIPAAVVLLGLLASAAAAGCNRPHEWERVERTGTTPKPSVGGGPAGPPASVADAAKAIASAACDRAVRCGDVGRSLRYATVDACRSANDADVTPVLGSPACAHPIDARRLDACVQKVRERPCEATLDPMLDLFECTIPVLCAQ